MEDWKGKWAAKNSDTPVKNSVALILPSYLDNRKDDIGHVAYVENVEGTTITLLDANYKHGKITRRTATGTDLSDSMKQLEILGFFDPSIQVAR